MHRDFRRLLEDATGGASFVIAVNADIRGFTPFSTEQESPAIAMFIKRVYIKMIDDYFADATFYKPTGDGLFVIFEFTEKAVKTMAETVVDACLHLVADFPKLCEDDPMVNFKVPDRLGIGVARGTASRLSSGEVTLDYSGKVLNLANRLMEIARPSGVVIDGAFGLDLLSEPIHARFHEDKVFLPGISTSEPAKVFYTKEWTHIPAAARKRPEEPVWRRIKLEYTVADMGKLNPRIVKLPSRPSDPTQIHVGVIVPGFIDGKRVRGNRVGTVQEFQYEVVAGRPQIVINFDNLRAHILTTGAGPTTKAKFEISYPE